MGVTRLSAILSQQAEKPTYSVFTLMIGLLSLVVYLVWQIYPQSSSIQAMGEAPWMGVNSEN